MLSIVAGYCFCAVALLTSHVNFGVMDVINYFKIDIIAIIWLRRQQADVYFGEERTQQALMYHSQPAIVGPLERIQKCWAQHVI